MTDRLFARQARLLEYLTSGAAIFGDDGKAPLDRGLAGIDRSLLQLEARFSHEKRMEKIFGVFPRTFELLASRKDAIIRGFVEACPPLDISRLVNARQFYDFLRVSWQSQAPDPAYLPDVAACEFACAKVRAGPDGEAGKARPGPRHVRRHPEVALVRCSYDVRAIFEENSATAVPPERDTPLAIAPPLARRETLARRRNDGEPRIFEIAPVVFDLLAALDDWTDPATFGEGARFDALIADLCEYELVEIAR
jgi:hypothetical protein